MDLTATTANYEGLVDVLVTAMYDAETFIDQWPDEGVYQACLFMARIYNLAIRLDLQSIARLANLYYQECIQELYLWSDEDLGCELSELVALAYDEALSDDGTLRGPLLANMRKLMDDVSAKNRSDCRAAIEKVFAAHPAFAYDLAMHRSGSAQPAPSTA